MSAHFTYRLDLLVLLVQELPNIPATQQHFAELRQRFNPVQPIVGLPSLGLPGYQTTSGVVLFTKDNMTLLVDATALPAQIEPTHVSQTDFAYQLATAILGCWTGD